MEKSINPIFKDIVIAGLWYCNERHSVVTEEGKGQDTMRVRYLYNLSLCTTQALFMIAEVYIKAILKCYVLGGRESKGQDTYCTLP